MASAPQAKQLQKSSPKPHNKASPIVFRQPKSQQRLPRLRLVLTQSVARSRRWQLLRCALLSW